MADHAGRRTDTAVNMDCSNAYPSQDLPNVCIRGKPRPRTRHCKMSVDKKKERKRKEDASLRPPPSSFESILPGSLGPVWVTRIISSVSVGFTGARARGAEWAMLMGTEARRFTRGYTGIWHTKVYMVFGSRDMGSPKKKEGFKGMGCGTETWHLQGYPSASQCVRFSPTSPFTACSTRLLDAGCWMAGHGTTRGG